MRRQMTVVGVGAAVWVAVDQITKVATTSFFDGRLGSSRAVVPGFFNYVFARNPGGAFSLLRDLEPAWLRLAFFIAASIGGVVLVMVLARQTRPDQRLRLFGLALVLGGAIGNLIDRALVGSVVDFLEFYWRDWHFPAFNVADIGITCGVTILVLEGMRKERPAQVLS